MSTLRITRPDRPGRARPDRPSRTRPIRREREALREILRLVAERAEAEAEVERARASDDDAADRDYREKRRALDDRFEGRRGRRARPTRTRRRAITDAAIAGEAAAKDEFARASRKIAAEFDAAREQARGDHAKARARADRRVRRRREAGRRPSTPPPASRSTTRPGSSSRGEARLAALFDDYRHFGLPEAPDRPRPAGPYKADDPLDKVFDRLQKLEPNLAMLEGLVIPKSMKGRRLPLALRRPVRWSWSCPLILARWARRSGCRGARRSRPSAGSSSRSSSTRSRGRQVSKFYYPLVQALVDAEALVGEARAAADERLKAERPAWPRPATRRSPKAKQKQAKAIADAEADRDERLRLINEVYARQDGRDPDQARPRDARGGRRPRQAHGRAARPARGRPSGSSTRSTGPSRRRSAPTTRPPGRRWPTRWHEGMARARADARRGRPRGRRLRPALGRPVLGRPARPRPRSRPSLRIGETRVDLDRAPRRRPGRPPADGGDRRPLRLPRPASPSPTGPTS